MPEQPILEFARAAHADDPFAFQFASQTYLLRTAGGGFESSEFPWSQQLLAELAAIRLPDRDPALLQKVGELLRRFVAPLGWAEYESRLLQAQRAGQNVVLTIRSAAAELYALPWELLTLKTTGQHLGGLSHVLLRYEWPETLTAAERTTRREDERVLFAWSAAGGAVPSREHAQAIAEACQAGELAFDAATDILENASCERLVAALKAARQSQRGIAVLHLLAHGGARGSTFGLLLDGGPMAGEPVVVDAGRLRQLLGPYADMIRLVVLSACDSGNSGALGNQLGSVAQTLHRAGFAAVVASRYPLGVAASIQLTQELYHQLLAESRSLEEALRHSRERLAQTAQQLDWASLQLYARPADGDDSRPVLFRPYRGLLHFQPRHSRFFFGREPEIAEISSALSALEQSQRPRFLIIAGASGSGKSSLVLAGVVPPLLAAAAGARRLAVLRPGSEPKKELAAALAPPAAGGARQLLLVVDQFEELFTHVSEQAVREDFVQTLWRLAADPASGVSVLLTLRVDFLGECGAIRVDTAGQRLDSVAYDQAHRVFLAWLASERLRAAIEGPAQRVGIVLEAGLTSRMLAAVGADPGALPLLSYTLDLLWQRRSGRTLTQKGYEAVGEVAGALSQHADALLARMNENEQRLARRLFVRLVHLGDGVAGNSRQRVPLARLRPSRPAEQADFDRVVHGLVDARLLLRAEERDQPTLEVAHEALIRGWPQLHRWLQEDRALLAKLEKLEALLVQRREHEALLSGAQLSFAEELSSELKDDFPPEAQALLRASQRQARQIQWIKRATALTLICGTLIFAYLFLRERDAHRQAMQTRDRLVELVNSSSQNLSMADLLAALARLHIELDLDVPKALQVIDQGLALEPHNPRLLTDRAEYLLLAGRLDAVEPAAALALAAETNPLERVHVAAVGWSSVTLRGPAAHAQQASWAARVQNEYAQLPPGAALLDSLNPTALPEFVRRLNRSGSHVVRVLNVYELLHLAKTDARQRQLTRILQEP